MPIPHSKDWPHHDDWLSLGEASTLLGVHASTLRRWADSGRVASGRTPGGHRRFSRQRLDPLLGGRPEDGAALASLDAGGADWRQRFEAAGNVESLRGLGQRLGGIVVQFLSGRDADERRLAECRRLGHEYAQASRQAKVGLSEAVAVFLHHKIQYVDTLAQVASGETPGNRLYFRYEACMAAVLLGLVNSYELPLADKEVSL